ncbi:hypothetical protein G4V62_13305 [Bacillaceae bacterium SIJ1]|uniref:hypothetical protein n=1 Tax=Litoribacterium kuwaitense TaxID=1398745 RepID=UPI0013EA5693|nr:hypothetical protein [Litoribacterium kuwaitense]
MVTIISESNVLEKVQDTIHSQAITVGFIFDNAVAIDATHFETKDHTSKRGQTKNRTQEECFLAWL